MKLFGLSIRRTNPNPPNYEALLDVLGKLKFLQILGKFPDRYNLDSFKADVQELVARAQEA